jgi:hypothetical protein
MTQVEAIIEAFESLGGIRKIYEIKNWVGNKYGFNRWKDFGTRMADMVPTHLRGNNTSRVPEHQRVLRRVKDGYYCLLTENID